jgi:hypothetical protein
LDINERFVEACATGDYQTVNTILETVKDYNIDVTDNLGRTALRLAVASEKLEVKRNYLFYIFQNLCDLKLQQKKR